MFCWQYILIYACNETNLMHYLSSVYSVAIPLHVSGLLVANHQEVTMYTCNNWYDLYVLADGQLKRTTRTNCCIQWTPRVTTGLTYEQLGLRPNCSFDLRPKSWVTTRMPVKATWVTTRMAFVSFSLSPDMRVCERNFGQCIALYN
jgi:hypothetical protein